MILTALTHRVEAVVQGRVDTLLAGVQVEAQDRVDPEVVVAAQADQEEVISSK